MVGMMSPIFNSPSWPGLTGPSTPFIRQRLQDVDARDKPGHDETF